MTRRPPSSTLFPTTPLSRSRACRSGCQWLPRSPAVSLCPPVTSGSCGATRHRQVDEGLLHVEARSRSEEHTSELQSPCNLVCRLLLEKKKTNTPLSSQCSED